MQKTIRITPRTALDMVFWAMAIPPVITAFVMNFTLDFPMLFGAGCTVIAWIIFVVGWRKKI